MKKITPYVSREDARGKLTGLMNSGSWEEFNYMETSAGQVRGNHYHKDTRELFYIIEGEIDVVVQFPEQAESKVTLHAGDFIEIEPMENHTFYCRTDTKWINFLSKRFDPDNPDFHVLGK
jgi:mannose-6-phosphate isomerase-like protein (cupin superfamily)